MKKCVCGYIGLVFLFFGAMPVAGFAQKMTFDSRWIWEYHNDWIAEGETGHRGEISVYHDSSSQAWLFTEEAYGRSGAALDFIVGTPDGRFVVAYRDVNGQKRKQVQEIAEMVLAQKESELIRRQFSENYRKGEMRRKFGETEGTLEGTEYVLLQAKGEEKTVRYLAASTLDFSPVAYFNHRNGDAELPCYFPTDIPPGYVLLEDETLSTDGKRIRIRLKSVTTVKRRINLKEYR